MHTRRSFIAAAVASAFYQPATHAASNVGFALFDSHVHFVSADIAKYPRAPSRDPARGDVGARLDSDPVTAEANLNAWDKNGVEAGLGVQYRTAYGEDNSYLLDTAAAHRQRVWPIVVLDAVDPRSPTNLQQLVAERGAVGLRITGNVGNFAWLDSPAALNTWAVAEAIRLPVELMYLPRKVNAEALQHIAALADRFPHAFIVLDHIGWPEDQGAPEFGLTAPLLALKSRRNIHFKFSSINLDSLRETAMPAEDFLRHAVDVYGAERIMWGSDRGNTPGVYDDLVARAIAATAKLTMRERRWILRDTARNMYVKNADKFRSRATHLLRG